MALRAGLFLSCSVVKTARIPAIVRVTAPLCRRSSSAGRKMEELLANEEVVGFSNKSCQTYVMNTHNSTMSSLSYPCHKLKIPSIKSRLSLTSSACPLTIFEPSISSSESFILSEPLILSSTISNPPTISSEWVCITPSDPSSLHVEGKHEQYCSSVLKKRRKKMNKHKYKKWRKKMRFKRRALQK